MDDFDKRFKAAVSHRKATLDLDGREVYKFCFNGREVEWDGYGYQRGKATEPEEIFSEFPATVAEDFAGELFSTMTPENTPWVEFETADGFEDKAAEDEFKAYLEQVEGVLAKSIRASNYYDEGYTAFQEAIVGNVNMWVDRPTLSGPIICEAIPCSELYLRAGPMGIDDRFRQQWYDYRDLPALFPDADFSREMKRKIEKGGRAKVIRGFWRDYADPSNPLWVQRVRVDGKPIGLDDTLGEEGSCPIVTGRFNAMPGSAWGRGPGRRMLPAMRLLDELVRMNIEGMDRNLDPAYTYANDGMLDLSDGIESGMGYPSMPGTENSVRAIGVVENLDYGFFEEDRLQEAIRDGFYREMIQRGKTPPSASQYMGQEQKQLRRVARPGAKTWREFGVGLLKRFEFIERQDGGALQAIEAPVLESGAVVIRPISPLERSQAREDVLVAQSIMAMTKEALGEQGAALQIDGATTMGNVKEKLKDKIVAFRTEDQMMKVMQAMQPPQPQGAPGEQA